jgi:hypothetical protein
MRCTDPSSGAFSKLFRRQLKTSLVGERMDARSQLQSDVNLNHRGGTMRPVLLAALSRLGALLVLAGLLGSAYLFLIRPAQLHWGATPEEVAQSMPEDSIVAHPAFDATRAITIRGTPEQIWPWLVQMGFRRAGFYGYDLIENAGSGTGMHSASAILPRFQHPQPRDLEPISVAASLVFDRVQPYSVVVWRSQDVPCDGVYIWQLVPMDSGHTRLISRIRWNYAPGPWFKALGVLTEFADHVAVRKILEGVRDRVEGRALEPLALEALAIAAWLLAFLELCAAALALVFIERWTAAWLYAAGAGSILLFTLYSNAPLWICAPLPWLYLVWMIRSWNKGKLKAAGGLKPKIETVAG